MKSNANYSFGIQFTVEQYDAMRKLLHKPIIAVFGENPERYYVLSSEDVDEFLWKGGTWIGERDFPANSRCSDIKEVVSKIVELSVGKVTLPRRNLNFNVDIEKEDNTIILLMLTRVYSHFLKKQRKLLLDYIHYSQKRWKRKNELFYSPQQIFSIVKWSYQFIASLI